MSNWWDAAPVVAEPKQAKAETNWWEDAPEVKEKPVAVQPARQTPAKQVGTVAPQPLPSVAVNGNTFSQSGDIPQVAQRPPVAMTQREAIEAGMKAGPPQLDPEILRSILNQPNPLNPTIRIDQKAMQEQLAADRTFANQVLSDLSARQAESTKTGVPVLATLDDKTLDAYVPVMIKFRDLFGDDLVNAAIRESEIRRRMAVINSLAPKARAAYIAGSNFTNLFGLPEYASRKGWHPVEKVTGKHGEVALNNEAARRVLAQINEADAVTFERAADMGASIARTVLEFWMTPNPAAKAKVFAKLPKAVQVMVSTGTKFGTHAALQAPGEGETLGERAKSVTGATAMGAGVGAAGKFIPNTALRIPAVTGGFMGLTALQGGSKQDVIATGVTVLGYEALGLMERAATATKAKTKEHFKNRAVAKAYEKSPALRSLPKKVVADGLEAISVWYKKVATGKMTPEAWDQAHGQAFQGFENAAMAAAREAAAGRTGGRQGAEAKPTVVQPMPELPPAITPKTTASVKMMITKADEAALSQLGYTDQQINAMKPEEAGQIITEQRQAPATPPTILAKPPTIQQATPSKAPTSPAATQAGARPMVDTPAAAKSATGPTEAPAQTEAAADVTPLPAQKKNLVAEYTETKPSPETGEDVVHRYEWVIERPDKYGQFEVHQKHYKADSLVSDTVMLKGNTVAELDFRSLIGDTQYNKAVKYGRAKSDYDAFVKTREGVRLKEQAIKEADDKRKALMDEGNAAFEAEIKKAKLYRAWKAGTADPAKIDAIRDRLAKKYKPLVEAQKKIVDDLEKRKPESFVASKPTPRNMAGKTRQPKTKPETPPIHQKAADAVMTAIKDRDAEALKKWLHKGNRQLRNLFTEQTGVKLPNTEGGTRAAIDMWAKDAATSAAETSFTPGPTSEPPDIAPATPPTILTKPPTIQQATPSRAPTPPAGAQTPPSPVQSTPPVQETPEAAGTETGQPGISQGKEEAVSPPIGEANTAEEVDQAIPALTSARQADIRRDRQALGLEDMPSAERKRWQVALDNAEKQGIPERAQRIATALNAKPRVLSDDETAGLVIAAARLKNEYAALMDEMAKTEDGAEIAMKAAEAERVEQEFDNLSKAILASGTEKGRALASQKLTLDQNYDLISVKSRAKAAKGKRLTAAESQTFQELTTKLDDAVKRIDDLQRQIEEMKTQNFLSKQNRTVRAISKMSKEARLAEKAKLVEKAKALLDSGCYN